MLDTITRRERPTAASQAANTKRMIGNMLANVKCVLRIIIVPMMNSVSIIPSKHNREDIKCERYINSPRSATVNASAMFMWTKDI